jgi:hypothetical protein
MESGRDAGHLLGGRRAHPPHQARLQAYQIGPTVLHSGEVPGHGQRVIKAPGC